MSSGSPMREVARHIDVTVMEPYRAGAHQPGPVGTIWVDGGIVAQFPLGIGRRRVRWLPAWVPGNWTWDESPSAVAEALRQLRVVAERFA